MLETIGCQIKYLVCKEWKENIISNKLSSDLRHVLPYIHGDIKEPSLPDDGSLCISL